MGKSLALTRTMLSAVLAALALVSFATGCAEDTASGRRPVTVVKNNDEVAPPEGGIPPDKQAEVQLLLQQRNPSTLKCYSDVLNEKHTREFKGTVIVLLTLEPSGKASDVKIIGGSMTEKEVTDCVVEKLKEFEYPEVPAKGTMQYVYRFEPAY